MPHIYHTHRAHTTHLASGGHNGKIAFKLFGSQINCYNSSLKSRSVASAQQIDWLQIQLNSSGRAGLLHSITNYYPRWSYGFLFFFFCMTDTLLGFAINLHGFFIAYAGHSIEILSKKAARKKGNKIHAAQWQRNHKIPLILSSQSKLPTWSRLYYANEIGGGRGTCPRQRTRLGQQVSASYQTQVIGHQAVIIIHSFIIIYYLLLFARHTWRMRDE